MEQFRTKMDLKRIRSGLLICLVFMLAVVSMASLLFTSSETVFAASYYVTEVPFVTAPTQGEATPASASGTTEAEAYTYSDIPLIRESGSATCWFQVLNSLGQEAADQAQYVEFRAEFDAIDGVTDFGDVTFSPTVAPYITYTPSSDVASQTVRFQVVASYYGVDATIQWGSHNAFFTVVVGAVPAEGSSDATLSALSYAIDSGEEIAIENFDADTYSYKVWLPYGTEKNATITLSGTCNDSNATISENNTASADYYGDEASIKVLAENGVTSKTYSVDFEIESPYASKWACFDGDYYYSDPEEVYVLNNEANKIIFGVCHGFGGDSEGKEYAVSVTFNNGSSSYSFIGSYDSALYDLKYIDNTITSVKLEFYDTETIAGAEPIETWDIAINWVDYAYEVEVGSIITQYTTFDKALEAVNESGGTLTLYTDVSGYGYEFTGTNAIVLDLNGHTINGGLSSSTSNGYVISVASGVTLTITDTSVAQTGTITGGYTSGFGGGIYNEGTLTLKNVTISGNIATNGGGIYLGVGAILNMYDSTITNNTVSASGGGVYVYGAAEFNMYSGEISYNSASSYYGGGVYVNGEFTLKDGEISNNSAAYGGGVCLSENGYVGGVGYTYHGSFVMEGGSISSNSVSGRGGGVYVGAGTPSDADITDPPNTFVMTGGVISNNKALYGYGGGVYISEEDAFNFSGGEISSNQAYISGGVTNLGTFEMSGTAKISNNTAMAAGGVYTINKFTMSGGEITDNEATSTDGGGVYACGTFIMSGGLISNNQTVGCGGGVYLYGTMEFSGGEIFGNSAVYGAGVYLVYSTMDMSGGKIYGNTASGDGGGIEIDHAILNMTAGEIYNNTASSVGGGVDVYESIMNMTGGSIYSNTAGSGGGVNYYAGTLTVGGTANVTGNVIGGSFTDGTLSGGTVNNIYLNSGLTIIFDSENAFTGSIGITSAIVPTVDSGNVKISNATYSDSGTITSDNDYGVYISSSEVTLGYAASVGDTLYGTFEDALAYANANGGTLTLLADVYLSDYINVIGTFTLDLNGYTIDRGLSTAIEKGYVIYVGEDASLTIKDSVGTGTITGGYNTGNGGGIYNAGTLTLENVTISGNSANVGGGIYNSGTLTIANGSITGNTAVGYGGGICNTGTLTIGGTANITGNVIGGTITGGTLTGGTKYNIFLTNEKAITFENDFTGSVGITTPPITAPLLTYSFAISSEDSTYLTGGTISSDNSNYEIKIDGSSVTLIAIEITITWNIDGKETTTTVAKGATPSLSDPTKESTDTLVYTFDGWATSANGDVLETIPTATANTTYYAVFSSSTRYYTVTFGDSSEDLTYGATISAPTEKPTKAATDQYTYTFAGWSLTDGGEVVTSYGTVSGDVTYYAIFTETTNQYDITFNLGNGESDVVNTLDYGKDITAPNDPEKDDDATYFYDFAGWYTSATGGEKVTAFGTVSGDVTYYAQYTEIAKVTAPSVDSTTFTYTGDELTYSLTTSIYYTISGNVQKDADEYTVTVSLKDSSATRWSDGTTDDIEYTFKISKATNKISDLAIEGWTYGDDANEPSAEADFGTIVYTYSTSENGTYTSTVPTNAGTYYVKASVTGTDNYASAEATKSFTIAKASYTGITHSDLNSTYTTTLTLSDITLGDNYSWVTGTTSLSAGTVSYDAIYNADSDNYNDFELTIKVVIAKADYVGITHADVNGTYTETLTLADIALSDNYSWVEDTTSLVAGTTSYDAIYNADSDNYNDFELTIKVVIAKADYVGITHADVNGTYTETLTLADIALSDNYSWVEDTTSLVAGTTSYNAIYNADSNNYNDFELTISVVIAKADTIITTTDVETSYTYTGSLQTVESGATINHSEGTIVYSDNSFTNVGNGTYTITISVAESDNYKAASVTVEISVAKAIVTAPSADSTAFTYTGNEQTYSLATSELYTIDGDTRTVAGTQNVTVALTDSDNYEWADGAVTTFTFTIAKADTVITTTDVETSYTYTGNVQTVESGATINHSESSIVYSDNTFTNVGDGTYTIIVSVLESDNYKAASVTVEISIAKATLSVVADSINSLKSDEELTYTISGLVGSDTATAISVNISRASGDMAGKYVITVSGSADNYNITFTNGVYTILTEDVEVTEPNADSNEVAGGVSSSSGIDPDAEIVLEKTETENFNNVVIEGSSVYGTYNVALYVDGVVVESTDTFTVKMAIPEDIASAETYTIVMNSSNGQQIITAVSVDGYLVFETNELGEFALLQNDANSMVWLIVLLAILNLAAATYLVLYYNKKRKSIKTMSIALPALLCVVSPVSVAFIWILSITLAGQCGLIGYNFINDKKKNDVLSDNISEKADIVEEEVVADIEEPSVAQNQEHEEETNISSVEETALVVSAIVDSEVVATTCNDVQSPVVQENDDAKMGIVIRYNKSFKAKLIQSDDTVKNYYCELKNLIMSNKKVTSRLSWTCESCNKGREKLVKFAIRGKTLCVYLALDPNEFTDSKIKVDTAKGKKFESTPCLCKIKNPSRFTVAKQLIEKLSEKFELEHVEKELQDYYLPYDTTENLIESKLIKELVSKEKYNSYKEIYNQQEGNTQKRTIVSNSDVEKIVSSNGRNIEVVMPAKVVDDVKETISVAEARNTNIVNTREYIYSETTKANVSKTYSKRNMKIVNIDTLDKTFEKNEIVTLDTLKSKGVVEKSATAIKILARGNLSKPLQVYANEFSEDAIKMIILTGGQVIKKA